MFFWFQWLTELVSSVILWCDCQPVHCVQQLSTSQQREALTQSQRHMFHEKEHWVTTYKHAKWQTFCVFVCPCHIHSLALKECWWTRKQVKMPAKALGCCKLMHNYFMLFFPTCYWYQSQGKELPRQWQTQKVLTLFNIMSASTSIAGFQPAQIWKLVISLWGLKNKSRLKAGSHIKVGWIPAGTLQLPAQI